ncbi:anthocyanidin 3-O-glucosyltransferase 2-like [Vicia villosa]|uniref:anthocyanidin 3-O-glucosyltransferase 2-like n=1 Tax=Vicia villosa TaxID=3911 RepID=UPI00273BBF5E|nr:anthocyanidin 3-O-glucosyltransferase 2-like [Vicia villosa]XP_058743023.1 anthocyanidin 3-O-glucosyltransferase 2-like [Vicia villosa]XP_058743024.1 anthocyanidin 3-O-glucosyltransferase 2-like [Vicia villosa]XP_058743025.1 anthocyanidin 3-O-glucosyltransferase 2-like [Vicia villosa]XP_058743026.1 anthocyanidin 3-O-glucosyltransferase 2-like [Vicia villosa]XP_058743027.1 anthocyanidin 3-O-glucosyltransferase 2-like [Vicia villosa]
MMKKAQVVFIPSPGVGHIVSTLEFAKLLINRDNRLRITVLIMKFPNTTETDIYTKSLPILDSLNIINLPECSLPPNMDRRSAMIALLEAQKPNVKQAVSNLTTGEAQHGRLAAFVVDMFCTRMIDVAKEFSVPTLVFFTSGVALLGLMFHLHTIHERDSVDSTQLLQLTELAVPSFANPVPTESLPSVVLQKEWESFFMAYCKGLKNADGIIVNSFEELESYAVHSFASHPDLASLTTIYPVGPILNLESKTKGSVDSDDTIKWLDDQPPSSVVFLCFGSRGSFYEDQIKEIAYAIEKSEVRFIWALRKPPPKGTMDAPSDYSPFHFDSILPKGFLDRTAKIGRVVGWAPQAQILAHPATGGFVSHCGWNSTLESIYFGVPIATWPHSAEQPTNAFELVCELKIAVEIALDYRVEYTGEHNYVVNAEKIERGIRSVLSEDEEIRKKVNEMSEKSGNTLLEGGSSYNYLGRLIDYIVNQI